MRLKLISCEVFYREMCAAVARSTNEVDAEFLPKGLHDIGSKRMLERIQAVVDRVECGGERGKYEAVLLGYGLCSNGLAGLEARSAPLVLPRAHDCITLFLGSRERYLEHFNQSPGTYFQTSGWIERSEIAADLRQLSIATEMGMSLSHEELVEKYGEDNARFLEEELLNYRRRYTQITFIEMGVEPDSRFEDASMAEAERRGWKFEKVKGDPSLIQRLVDGKWDAADFLVVPPGSSVAAAHDESIVRVAPHSGAGRSAGRSAQPPGAVPGASTP